MPMFRRPNVLTVLLEYSELPKSEWQHEINIWEGHPSLCYTILLDLILSLTNAAKCILFEFVTIMPPSCTSLTPAISGKIDSSL